MVKRLWPQTNQDVRCRMAQSLRADLDGCPVQECEQKRVLWRQLGLSPTPRIRASYVALNAIMGQGEATGEVSF